MDIHQYIKLAREDCTGCDMIFSPLTNMCDIYYFAHILEQWILI